MNRLITLLLFLSVAIFTDSRAMAAAPVPIQTNKSRFRIPYQFDTAELKRIGAKEVRLYVSRDQGRTWKQSQAVVPGAGRFEFTASKDGEYWFSVRTIDRNGRFYPAGKTIIPGLAVIVDTMPPKLSLSLKQHSPGKVELVWSATDAHLKTNSLHLESRNSPKDNWMPVSIAPAAHGRTSWTLPQGGMVEVRGQIQDKSSNEASVFERVKISARAFSRPMQNPISSPSPMREKPFVPDFSQPIAQPPVMPGAPLLTNNMPSLPSNNLPNRSMAPYGANRFGSSVPAMNIPSSTSPMMLPSVPSPPVQQPSRSQSQEHFASSRPWMKPQITQGRYPKITEKRQATTGNQQWRQRGASRRHVRVSNSHTFQIGYQLEDIGPSGVGGVELYITEDNGQKWWKYGEDKDLKSPFDVTVPSNGEYGFTIRVRNGVGLAASPPQPGEQPDTTVLADAVAPKVQAFHVQQGQGANFNQLTFSWQITDDELAERPVSLSYSATPNGPWEPIGGWQADLKSYRWTVGRNLPPQLYFRIAARDRVGNTSYQTIDKPTLIDLTQPTARILDVAPVNTMQTR